MKLMYVDNFNTYGKYYSKFFISQEVIIENDFFFGQKRYESIIYYMLLLDRIDNN